MDLATNAGVLARVLRGGVIESVHLGHLVIIDSAGQILHSVGDPFVDILPRSAIKPLQTLAATRSGFSPDDDAALALASSSHSGEPMHIAGVSRMLADVGLAESALDNVPALPMDYEAAFAWRESGREPEPIAQNCSGKHAAMLAACVASGWDATAYRDLAHPVQVAIRDVIAEFTGDLGDPFVVVDGCGAPQFSTSLIGLARAFSRLATATPGTDEARIAAAMSAHPELVGGTGRDVTLAMRAVPGLICKDGAEGGYAGALPDGTAFAFKVLDGSSRPRPAILARVLAAAGALQVPAVAAAALRELGTVPVLGHGEPVGKVEAAF